jgi:hypothetical protein
MRFGFSRNNNTNCPICSWWNRFDTVSLCFQEDLDFQSYRELDQNFMDLIKEGLKYPHFWVEEKTKNYRNSFLGEEKDRYEIYSLLAWNICESVYDKKR